MSDGVDVESCPRTKVRTYYLQFHPRKRLVLLQLFEILINRIYISITMSWLFGSSNGKSRCLLPSTRVEYLRNAPFLHIGERSIHLTLAYTIPYREKRRCPRASVRSARPNREAQGMTRCRETNKRKRLTSVFFPALLRLQSREDCSR